MTTKTVFHAIGALLLAIAVVALAWDAPATASAEARVPDLAPVDPGPVAVPPAVRKACDMVYGVAATTPGVSITRRSKWSRDDALPHAMPGCGFDVSGSFVRAGSADAAVTRLRNALTARGWQEVPGYAADGKDGTAFAYRARGVVCLVRGEWDGGADGEPEIPPEDWYKAFVFCTDDLPDMRPGPHND